MGGTSGKIKIMAILFTLVVITAMMGASYISIRQWWVKNQPHTSLHGMKINADVLRWSFLHTPELYAQLVALDDYILVLDQELGRLKELGKKYTDQKPIVEKESRTLKEKRDELAQILSDAGKAVEAIYVTYTIDARKGQAKIESKETYDLGRHLASTLRTNGRTIYRIKSQNPEKWIDKIKKIL